MSTKFFNNTSENTLFDKMAGIRANMPTLHSFHAVVGYFRSSGYFKVREVLGEIDKIQILVGINIDDIFRGRNKAMFFMAGDQERKAAFEQYRLDFVKDVQEAGYSRDIEQGILQLVEDLSENRVELRIHATKNLHAKFYLFLPESHNEHSDGWVIMGSSNLSESGLGISPAPRYELNVAMKDFDDVSFCRNEFERLWNEALPLSHEDILAFQKDTYLGVEPTPYQLYMKLLIDFFGPQVEDDFSLSLPNEFKDLKYQRDAVCQGYQMLLKYNGFFLADVVGLGKTVIATMIVKRFIEENGTRNTRILVVYPPAIEHNWRETFEKFGITRFADFITNGSLEKIHDGQSRYRLPEEYDLIVVDEAHRFRSDSAQMYDSLQRLCKTARCPEHIRVGDFRKKVILISATPLNNYPSDLYNLILLFQDKNVCTIEGVPSLQNLFAPWINSYKTLVSGKNTTLDLPAVQKLYDEIRRRVMEKITIRRTRSNIENYPEYKQDLVEQGIMFPSIEKPHKLSYQMSSRLETLFLESLKILAEKLTYSRYKAISALDDTIRTVKYPNADQTSRSLAIIYRTFMVKRLESSFTAFRTSLENLCRATRDMLDMFNRNQVVIAPDLKIGELLSQGKTFEEIIEKGRTKYNLNESDFVFKASDFRDGFVGELNADVELLDALIENWRTVSEDPKKDVFLEHLEKVFFDSFVNPSCKLVVFTESKTTAQYLEEAIIAVKKRRDVLCVSSENRDEVEERIRNNFDANIPKVYQRNDINILLTTDVLSEGVNLHRANVIVNYDTPWNAVRMMQRIGRVNRIGSVAGRIVNYMFYPSTQGDREINLIRNHLAKLQGFHSALGEDSQIYSADEIVESFELFNPRVADETDKTLGLLSEVRDFFAKNPKEYAAVRDLPLKARTGRIGNDKTASGTTLVYISDGSKKEFYQVVNDSVDALGFLEAADLFKAEKEEKPHVVPDSHYSAVVFAQKTFERETLVSEHFVSGMGHVGHDKNTLRALKLLRDVARASVQQKVRNACTQLTVYVERGSFTHLTRQLAVLQSRYGGKSERRNISFDQVENKVSALVDQYHIMEIDAAVKDGNLSSPCLILSETFL